MIKLMINDNVACFSSGCQFGRAHVKWLLVLESGILLNSWNHRKQEVFSYFVLSHLWTCPMSLLLLQVAGQSVKGTNQHFLREREGRKKGSSRAPSLEEAILGMAPV